MNNGSCVTEISASQEAQWNKYVISHSEGTLYHLAGWRNIIKNSYGHQDHYLMAIEKTSDMCSKDENAKIKGILPLVHIKHFIFGNCMISLPFCDYGGILANDWHTQQELETAAVRLAERLKIDEIELRNIGLHNSDESEHGNIVTTRYGLHAKNWKTQIRTHKVRMLFELPDTEEELMNSFKSKLRSQIRKPMKAGLETRIGGLEFLDDFYNVFSRNMKELGSPVHSKKLIKNVISEFREKSGIVMVYHGSKPLAGSVIVGFKDTLENPWASSLREYSKLSPNMLLYWAMLAYACENRYREFDFGRSSLGEGTYKFKEQWGAKPVTLHWRYLYRQSKDLENPISEDARFQLASKVWKKLPEQLTKMIGPCIRKYIGL